MKKLIRTTKSSPSERPWATASLFIFCLTLSFAFCLAMTPTATAREMTPRQIIETQLPVSKTLANASKSQVLSAVCASVKRFRKDTTELVEAAIIARKEFAADMVENVIHCLGKPDCTLVQNIVDVAIAANPDAASEIADAALVVTPNCADAIQQAGVRPPGEGPNEANLADGPTNQNPPPGSVGGGGDPQGATVLICDNGTQVNIAASQVQSYLQTHQGAFAGSCQVTPITNP